MILGISSRLNVPVISDSLTFLEEIGTRMINFVYCCLNSDSELIRPAVLSGDVVGLCLIVRQLYIMPRFALY
jgi:hypothetical protein